jgi:hypothetical protein
MMVLGYNIKLAYPTNLPLYIKIMLITSFLEA